MIGITATIRQIDQQIDTTILACLVDILKEPKGYLITRSRSIVIKQTKRTLASEETVDIIPARLHHPLLLQRSSSSMYLLKQNLTVRM
jgi:hypothetical protein